MKQYSRLNTHEGNVIILPENYVRNKSHPFLPYVVLVCAVTVTATSLYYLHYSFSVASPATYMPEVNVILISNKVFEGDNTNNNIVSSVVNKISLEQKLVLTASRKQDTCSLVNDDEKLDCYPEGNVNEQLCNARGCCWKSLNRQSTPAFPPLGVPYCFYPTDYKGYKVVSVTPKSDRTTVLITRVRDSGYPSDISVVQLDVINYDYNTVRIKFTDPSKSRYEVPFMSIPITSTDGPVSYNISVSKDGLLTVQRASTKRVLFRTDLSKLIFSDQFLQLSSDLGSRFVYGLGEHKSTFLKDINWTRFTFMNRDRPPTENSNLYATHPFYLVLEEGLSHGVFLLNSNPMDIILQPSPAITFRTIGGILDFFVILEDSPSAVIKRYQSLVGLPCMPPYWSLGFHLSRLGLTTVNDTRNVMARNIRVGIPIDTQWNDLDYMMNRNDFTVDFKNFGNLSAFVDELHAAGHHYVPLIDVGVSGHEVPGTYPPLDDGLAMDVFVKNSSGQVFYGKVWNEVSTVFPDFTHPRAAEYWTKQFQNFYNIVKIDGAWIDMNEPSNFLDGQTNGCPQSSLENPQYIPGGVEPLFTKTLCMTARHHASLHYNVHNIHGFTEGIATNIALKTVRNKRPFIISRSTFIGSGHYTGSWNGDVYATWESMRWTISSILGFNLYGIPMIGADICGFNDNTTVELCARWHQLGAFYPFSRNHNSDDCIDQDPFALGPVVISSAKKALTMRYFLLPYLYTLFFRSHVHGETVARPLFFEFPDDKLTYTLEEQFLWGPALLIAPALYEGSTEVTVYLPNGTWYHLTNHTTYRTSGQNYTLSTPLDSINLLLRGGYIIPAQKPGMTTAESTKNPYHLLVALSENGIAFGELYIDDGDSLDTVKNGSYNQILFSSAKNFLATQCTHCHYKKPMPLDAITVFGVTEKPDFVDANGRQVPFSYSSTTQVLQITGLQLSLADNNSVTW